MTVRVCVCVCVCVGHAGLCRCDYNKINYRAFGLMVGLQFCTSHKLMLLQVVQAQAQSRPSRKQFMSLLLTSTKHMTLPREALWLVLTEYDIPLPLVSIIRSFQLHVVCPIQLTKGQTNQLFNPACTNAAQGLSIKHASPLPLQKKQELRVGP